MVERVKHDYGDAYHTAHLEVPGEMFALAMDAQVRPFLCPYHVEGKKCVVKESGGSPCQGVQHLELPCV